jgi:hypothetical protein
VQPVPRKRNVSGPYMHLFRSGHSAEMETLGNGDLLVFTSEGASGKAADLQGILKRVFRKNGFEIDEIDERRYVLAPSRDLIEHEATHAGLQKMLTREAQAEQGMIADDFDYETRTVFHGVDEPYFFSPAEICMLSHRVLYSVKVWTARTLYRALTASTAFRAVQGNA